jgi:hypothetical protein
MVESLFVFELVATMNIIIAATATATTTQDISSNVNHAVLLRIAQ